MIKYYCDRCGVETKKLEDARIPNTRDSLSFLVKTVSLCHDCKAEADSLHEKSIDIEFLLFKDFMKGGAE